MKPLATFSARVVLRDGPPRPVHPAPTEPPTNTELEATIKAAIEREYPAFEATVESTRTDK